jgi:thymidylate synthase ThyX
MNNLDFSAFLNSEIKTDSGFQFGKIPASKTAIDLVFIHDPKTKITIYTAVSASQYPFQSVLAFAGARYSRADGIISILSQIQESNTNADKKLGNIVNNYGHSSVAEMANIPIYIEGLTKFQSERLFHLSAIYSGQERSSRYQKLDGMQPVSLGKYFREGETLNNENMDDEGLFSDAGLFNQTTEDNFLYTEFENIQRLAKANYLEFFQKTQDFYINHFSIDTNSKKEMNTVISRSLDTARYFLPLGAMHTTSMALFTNAREWSRLIGQLQSKTDLEAINIAAMLKHLLAPTEEIALQLNYTPEAAELIRYTSADEITGDNLQTLQNYLETLETFQKLVDSNFNEIKFINAEATLFGDKLSSGGKLILQNILCLYPTLNIAKLSVWLQSLSKNEAEKLGTICFQNFNHHRQIGQPLSTNQVSFELKTDFGAMMDLNRHRAWGRFNPIFNYLNFSTDLIKNGFVLPLYLTEIPEMKAIKDEFEKRMLEYYKQVEIFWNDASQVENFPKQALIDLLPLAHNANILMHASAKEIDYMTKLRVRPGGHINYRFLVYQMQQEVIKADPFFRPQELTKPDSNSKAEFMDRS